MKTHTSYTWAIFHINNKFYQDIKKELRDRGYEGIRVCVPTVSILKKKQKGKDIFEDIPLLFNYGFIRMPVSQAYNRQFLNKLRREITGIHSWVKSLEGMHPKRRRSRVENAEDHDDYSLVATASWEDVKRLKNMSKQNQAYNKTDIIKLQVGSYVTLRGYPFEGIDAEVAEVNPKNNKLKVILYPSNNGSKIISTVSFEHAIYSIYHNYDESLQSSKYEMDSSVITQDDIDNTLKRKQY